MITTTYQPRGRMCLSCTKKLDNCSKLDFKSMQVLEVVPNPTNKQETISLVKCNQFERAL